ncbi:hypothetical protein SAMN04515656_1376 [Eubacterium aggregans]|uniref:Uncharacterized protein n=1 Tax=Eubacterium aggregans TaxID=81409 RepID=A0A1H4EC18_9FIRM|nr:hypothetical protein [Eubacterium aggregans]SEA82591.1 hypothetical protein SAMN04515656_1376 [Eubacterium aggregans]
MKKGLIVALIAANVIMLVVGVFTIPPNLLSVDAKGTPAPGTEQTVPITPSPEEQTPPATTESGGVPSPEETGASLSTEKRPDLEDFLWYTEDVAYDGVPSDANIIDNIDPLTGGWKAIIIYDPNDEYDAGAMEFLNIALAGTAESLSLTLDWYQIFWANEGERFDETDMEDGVFSGKWENGGLWASGAGTIRLTQFYEKNGKQYAIGTMDTPDGIPALVALVRP